MSTQDSRRLRWLLVFNGVVGLFAVSPLLIVVIWWDTLTASSRTGPAAAVLFFMLSPLTILAGFVASLLGSLWKSAPAARSPHSTKWQQ